MPLVDFLKGAFSSGELSPRMAARTTIDRYKNGAIQLENFRVLVQGGVTRCEGTRFIAAGKLPGDTIILLPFEPSTLEAYVLELGHLYIRFYRNHARIETAPMVPVEVTTPYLGLHLRGLRTAQSNDVMFVVHGVYAPRRLSRLSDTQWDLRPISFDPPPTFEAGVFPGAPITLSGTTGEVTASSAFNVFVPADEQRQLVAGIGRAIVTDFLSPTAVTLRVLDTFAATTFTSGNWRLTGSPVAAAKPSAAGPVGARVTVTLQGTQGLLPDLVTNGAFATDLTGWTNYTGVVLATGTHDGPNASDYLNDNDVDFLLANVQPGQRLLNVTDVSSGLVAGVLPHQLIIGAPGLTGGANGTFSVGDTYEIYGTGTARVAGGIALLSGGAVGPPGWIEQAIATTPGLYYEVTFTVSLGPVAFLIGSAPRQGNILAEASYPIGTQTVQFLATSPAAYLQFRNNQPSDAGVDDVIMRQYTMGGFRPTEVPSFVRINGGLIRVLDIAANNVVGEVLKELTTDQAAAAGAWTLEAPQWSDALGWPQYVMLYEGRLYFAATARFPQTIWGSAVDDLFNFHRGPKPDDAVEFTLLDSGGNITLNLIRWMMPAENALVGTTHGEYRLVGSGDDPISAVTLPRNRIQSTYGSDAVQPLKIGANILFAQRQGSKLREMTYDITTQTTFDALDITVTSDHLLKRFPLLPGVSMVYQQEPESTVWAVRGDGILLGLTYYAREEVKAWWRRTTPVGVFESVVTIPHPSRNAHEVWAVVRRDIGGVQVKYIELFDPYSRMVLPEPVEMVNELTEEVEMVDGWDGLTMDCCLVHTLGPEDHFIAPALVGAEVTIIGDGLVFPTQVMPVGGITLPQKVSTCWIGLAYTAHGRTMPLELPVRGETHQGKRKAFRQLRARVEGTASLTLLGQRLPFRKQQHPNSQGVPPFSGDIGPAVLLGTNTRGMVSFAVEDPLPCTILGIYGTAEVEAER